MINVLRSMLEAKVHHLAEKSCGLIRFASTDPIDSRKKTFWNNDSGFHNWLLDLADMRRCVHDVRKVRWITNDDRTVPVHHFKMSTFT